MVDSELVVKKLDLLKNFQLMTQSWWSPSFVQKLPLNEDI